MKYFFEALNISTGNFPDSSDQRLFMKWVVFFISVINMTIMMLNVIIAIVSDTYSEFEL